MARAAPSSTRCQAKRWADGTGKLGFTDMGWVNSDLDLSMSALKKAFPDADISTFVPPENLATVSVLKAVQKKGLNIVSTAAAVRCNCRSTCYPDDEPALDNPDSPNLGKSCNPTAPLLPAPYPLDCSTVPPTTNTSDPAVYTPKFPKFNYNYQPCQPLNIPPRLGIDPTTGELKVTPRICSEFIPPNCPAGACINSADGYTCKDCADLEEAECTGPSAGGNDLCIWKSNGYTPPAGKTQCVNAYCIPPEDKYWKNETGFQKLDATAFDAGLFSVPTGSANSLLSDDGIGLSPKQSFGEDTCGTNSCADTLGKENCTLANASGDSTCSVVAAAKSAADRSDGIHWTVMMMHPQTMFDGYEQTTIAEDKAATPPRNRGPPKWGTCPYGCHLDADECWQHIMTGKGYASWMDDYLAESKQLKDFEVHFVHFSDLLDICFGQSRVLAVEQCAAWVQIYDATSGDAWAAKACGSSSSSSKFRTDPCSCAGVTCERKTIVSIELASMGLTGTLPPSVSKLTNLRTFEVQGNTLRGKLPDLPKSLTTCKLLGSSPTNRFACPVCAGADKGECRANSNATCVATTTCTKDVAGVVTKLTTSDCDPCHSLSAIEIGGICLGAIALMCLVNMKRTRRGPFASANGREREDNASLFEATAPILIDSEALLLNRPPSDEEEGVELPGGRGVEQTMGRVIVHDPMDASRPELLREPTRLAERPAERRTLGLQTSNVNKYSKGQMVFDMGKDKMCGIVTAVEATVAGRPAGTITVAVYETKVLPVESTSQWPVGQRLEGEDSGIVAKSVPSTQGARAQFSSTQSAAMRSADPSNLVGQRLHVFDTEAGRLGTVTSVKSCKGGSSKHSIKFDEGDREPELVSLQKTKGASKGVRFRLENAAAAQAGTVTIFLD